MRSTPRTLGLLGGMSWESSVEYERLINRGVRARLGGSHSADLIVRSYDFAAIEEMQQRGEWEAAGALLAADAGSLETAGAEAIVLCTNTMHRVADDIEAAIGVPLIHMADATARAVKGAGVHAVGLLGTRYTMEQGFYRDRLESHGLSVVVPGDPDRRLVHDIIFRELVRGVTKAGSKERFLEVIARLVAAGAEGVIAGCTEIELLVGPDDVDCPYFPTTRLHAEAAVDWCLSD